MDALHRTWPKIRFPMQWGKLSRQLYESRITAKLEGHGDLVSRLRRGIVGVIIWLIGLVTY